MAYDLQQLGERLKPHGLDLAEDAAAKLVSEVLDWAAEEAVKSENKVDDVIGALAPIIKPVLLEQVDRIDGEKG